jgi:sterol desaturase/sphingolipid hydroxylase (fatty acid hydroxylase superfamily)
MTEHSSIADVVDVVIGSFIFDLGRYLVAAALMSAIVWLLMKSDWRSRKIQARRATNADYRREILLSLRTVVVFVVVSVFTYIGHMSGWLAGKPQAASGLAITLYVLAMVFAHDAYFYWVHRAMHHPRLFRAFHRSHHRSVTPTPWAAYAFDLPEALVMALFMPLWLFLVPTPEVAIFVFLAIMIVRNVMAHAGLELHARGWASHPVLKWVSTTTHHDLHHSGNFNSNYGFYFTFWDKLMGTENPNYVGVFDEVTARPARADVPRLSGRLVMGGFLVATLTATALPLG